MSVSVSVRINKFSNSIHTRGKYFAFDNQEYTYGHFGEARQSAKTEREQWSKWEKVLHEKGMVVCDEMFVTKVV